MDPRLVEILSDRFGAYVKKHGLEAAKAEVIDGSPDRLRLFNRLAIRDAVEDCIDRMDGWRADAGDPRTDSETQTEILTDVRGALSELAHIDALYSEVSIPPMPEVSGVSLEHELEMALYWLASVRGKLRSADLPESTVTAADTDQNKKARQLIRDRPGIQRDELITRCGPGVKNYLGVLGKSGDAFGYRCLSTPRSGYFMNDEARSFHRRSRVEYDNWIQQLRIKNELPRGYDHD